MSRGIEARTVYTGIRCCGCNETTEFPTGDLAAAYKIAHAEGWTDHLGSDGQVYHTCPECVDSSSGEGK